ncbi:hypothetical protein [Roseburia sp. 831b]|uniref:hypothetical protein n=1 Tax=Roseburia sp. 831b TaxID=1261635 RepID=UPI0009511D12|nr:hypothetical protein [Roseburia sp. 831b]WVK72683.1 hypothetical protein BIV16_13220 [Roseburia sp. 831b]
MKNKIIMGMLTVAVTTASFNLVACGTTEESTNVVTLKDTEVVGTVESVDDDTITLTLGSVVEMNNAGMGGGMGGGQDMGNPPDMPGGDSSGNTNGGDTQNSDASGQASDSDTQNSDSLDQGAPSGGAPSGEAPSGEAPSGNAPGGEAPSGNAPGQDASSDENTDSTEDGNTQSDSTESDNTENASGQDKGSTSDDNTDNSVFVASETTATFTVSDTSVLEDTSMDDISEGTILEVTLDENGEIESISVLDISEYGAASQDGQMANGAPGSSSASDITYTAVNEITEDTQLDGETISSDGTDESAVLVSDGATATLSNLTVDRTSSDSTGGDNSSFYGVGAALLTTNGTTYVNKSTITTDSAGGAGVFSYGDGVTYVADSTITTKQDTSGGIHAAGGGTLYARDLNVETNGESSAAIRSDRGGGTMVVDGGSYTSNGTGSPAVYCTADITVNDAKLNATNSEGICIEGLNTLRLFGCDLTSNMPDNEQNDNTWSVILYQSMSGDSEVGNSEFYMVGGTLTSQNGGLFYTTNTGSSILLSDVDINYSDDDDFFLQVTGNTNQRGWGTAGENGAQCIFTGDNQEMQGTIVYDSISTLDFYMTNGSTLTGNFVDDETYAGNGGDGYCNVYLSDDSTWVVTADSEIDDLYNAGTIVDENGDTVSIVGTDGTVYVKGTSSYTITVKSYSTEDKSSEALQTPSYGDYEVDKPSELV